MNRKRMAVSILLIPLAAGSFLPDLPPIKEKLPMVQVQLIRGGKDAGTGLFLHGANRQGPAPACAEKETAFVFELRFW